MAPLWKDCVEFLSLANVLGDNVEIESLAQLAVLLSDGVILCKFARLLSPECIDENKILRRHSLNERSDVSFKGGPLLRAYLRTFFEFF